MTETLGIATVWPGLAMFSTILANHLRVRSRRRTGTEGTPWRRNDRVVPRPGEGGNAGRML